MRKIFLCVAAALTMHLSASAQGIEVVSNTPLPISQAAYAPVISPTGEFVLVTTNAMKGLQKFDLNSGAMATVTTDNGAGYNPKISSDGKVVVYRESNFKNKLRYITIKSLNLATGKTETLVKDSRSTTAFAVNEGTALAVESNKLKTKHILGKKISASEAAVVGIENGNLMLTRNGKTVTFNPKGNTRYLWASVSPDGNKVLFAVPEKGMVAYVCDINGNGLTRIGRMSAPAWMGNDWVVGMDDKDNGEVVTASAIVAARANGNDYTTLTDNASICMYPSASIDASKIVYNTADGKIFIMNVKTK